MNTRQRLATLEGMAAADARERTRTDLEVWLAHPATAALANQVARYLADAQTPELRQYRQRWPDGPPTDEEGAEAMRLLFDDAECARLLSAMADAAEVMS